MAGNAQWGSAAIDRLDLVTVATPNAHLKSPEPSSRRIQRVVRKAPHSRHAEAKELVRLAREQHLQREFRLLWIPNGASGRAMARQEGKIKSL